MERTIIGIDCAVDPRNVGLALGRLSEGTLEVLQVATPGKDRPAVDIITGWIADDVQTLLALDAPLGWPADLGEALSRHAAGRPVGGEANKLFRRETDRSVKERICKQPLDVGADRIARTAYATLDLLDKVRRTTGHPIPLAWDPTEEGPVAIEVYPAATLKAHGMQHSRYKREGDAAERARILEALQTKLTLRDSVFDNPNLLPENPDVLDAVVCVLAGHDFLCGNARRPEHMDLALKEGWIWVRDPVHECRKP